MSEQPAEIARTPSRRRQVFLRVTLGLVVSLGFVALAAYSLVNQGITWEEIQARLGQGNYFGVAGYALLLMFLHGMRVVRWGIQLRGMGPVSWRKIAAVGSVGQMAIGLFPMRLGEAVRPLLIVDGGPVNLGQATATVVVERIVDGIVMGGMFALTLWFLRDMTLPWEFSAGAIASAVLFGGMAVFLVIAFVLRGRLVRILRRLLTPIAPGLAGRLIGLVEAFLGALKTIVLDGRRGAAYLILTGIMWVLTGASLVPVFWAFGVDLPVVGSFAVVCVMVLGSLIPAGPASTGTLNYAIILALAAFGVDQSTQGALAILLFVVITGVNLLVGLLGLWIGGFRVSALWRRPALAAPGEAAPTPTGGAE